MNPQRVRETADQLGRRPSQAQHVGVEPAILAYLFQVASPQSARALRPAARPSAISCSNCSFLAWPDGKAALAAVPVAIESPSPAFPGHSQRALGIQVRNDLERLPCRRSGLCGSWAGQQRHQEQHDGQRSDDVHADMLH